MTINVLGTNVPIFSSSKVVTNEEIFISCEALILSSPVVISVLARQEGIVATVG